MARSAIVWQPKRHVRRIVAVGEVRRVAGVALGRSSGEYIVDMARRALQRRVCTGQRVTRVLQVVELRADKVVHSVAGFARGGEIEGHVVDDRRQEVLLVARVASSRQPHKLARRSVLVALIALHQGMGAHQGEAILVVLDILDRHLPALDRVAALAVGSELAPMNVRVTIRALGAYLLEHHVRVALRACNLGMHSAQRVARLVVIELGIRP